MMRLWKMNDTTWINVNEITRVQMEGDTYKIEVPNRHGGIVTYTVPREIGNHLIKNFEVK